MSAGEQRAVAHVEPHHRQRPTRVEDDRSGFGIAINVGLRRSVDVAAGHRAAHHHDFLHQTGDGGIFRERQREVGQRSDGHERDLARIFVDKLDDEVRAEARVSLALGRRQLDIGQAVHAMPELGRDELLSHRMPGARGHGYVAASRQ